MKPIEYLRAKARQRRPATGGIIRGEHGPELVNLPTGYVVPTPKTTQAEAMPTGIIRIEYDLTDDDAERVRQRFEAVLTPKPSRGLPLRCPCVAIYSKCRCPDTNISAQTNTADFHAEHQ